MVKPMRFKISLWNSAFLRVLLAVWIVTSFLVIFFLYSIDNIVNVDLYHYGLRFNVDWAVPYWNILRLTYACLFIPAALSVAALVTSVPARAFGEKRVDDLSRKAEPTAEKAQVDEHMFVTCPSCKKPFTRTVVVLDMTGGKTRFKNFCPHCDYCFDNGREKKTNNNVHVVEPEKKVIT